MYVWVRMGTGMGGERCEGGKRGRRGKIEGWVYGERRKGGGYGWKTNIPCVCVCVCVCVCEGKRYK